MRKIANRSKISLGFLILFILCAQFTYSANAAGSKPIIELNCGNLLKLKDDKGDYLYFNPTVRITYWGAPLSIVAYYSTKKNTPISEQGKVTIKQTKKVSSSRKFVDYFDLSYEFLRYGQKSNGYFHMDMTATDSLGRRAAYKCVFNGDYGFPRASNTQSNDSNSTPLLKPSATPSPSPTETTPKNDLIGLTFFYNEINSSIGLAPILQSRSTGTYYFGSLISEKSTALKRGSLVSLSDFWQDKVLACPTTDCLQKTYVLGWGDDTVSLVSVEDVKSPDGYSGPYYKKSVFGKTNQVAFIHTDIISPIEGLKSVIHKVDLISKVKTPVFATYCFSFKNLICNLGSQVSSISINKQTGLLYVILEMGSSILNSTSTTENNYWIFTVPYDSTPVTLRKASEASGKFYFEGQSTPIYNEKDASRKLSQVTPVPNSSVFYFRRSPLGLFANDNEICRYSSGSVNCKLVTPFDSLSIIQAIDEDKVLYSKFTLGNPSSDYYIFDFNTQTSKPVINTSGSNPIRFG